MVGPYRPISSRLRYDLQSVWICFPFSAAFFAGVGQDGDVVVALPYLRVSCTGQWFMAVGAIQQEHPDREIRRLSRSGCRPVHSR